MIGWAEDFKSSAWVLYFKPALDYIVRLAELITLAAIFRVAADRVDSFFLELMATLLVFVIGAYSGIPLGLLHHRLTGVTVKSLSRAIAIALPISLLIAGGSYVAGREVSSAIRSLGDVSVGSE